MKALKLGLFIILIINLGFIKAITRTCGFSLKESNKAKFMEHLSHASSQRISVDENFEYLKGVFDEINLLRTNPKKFAEYYKEMLTKKFIINNKPVVKFIDDDEQIYPTEGFQTIEDAITALEAQKSLPPLKWSNGISLACRDTVVECLKNDSENQGDQCDNANEKSDAEIKQRVNEYGNCHGKPLIGDISKGRILGLPAVLEIYLDDGDTEKKRRGKLLDENIKFMGAAYSDRFYSAKLGHILVVYFAEKYEENKTKQQQKKSEINNSKPKPVPKPKKTSKTAEQLEKKMTDEVFEWINKIRADPEVMKAHFEDVTDNSAWRKKSYSCAATSLDRIRYYKSRNGRKQQTRNDHLITAAQTNSQDDLYGVECSREHWGKCKCDGWVRFGQNKFSDWIRINGEIDCSKKTFGDPDKTQKDRNICYCKGLEPPNFITTENGQWCASEKNTCQCKGEVRLGNNGKFSQWKQVNGEINCNVSTFGDPYPKNPKHCFCKPTVPAKQITHYGFTDYWRDQEAWGKCMDDDTWEKDVVLNLQINEKMLKFLNEKLYRNQTDIRKYNAWRGFGDKKIQQLIYRGKNDGKTIVADFFNSCVCSDNFRTIMMDKNQTQIGVAAKCYGQEDCALTIYFMQ